MRLKCTIGWYKTWYLSTTSNTIRTNNEVSLRRNYHYEKPLFLEEIKYMTKISLKKRHKRYLKRHPEKVIKSLDRWISKEKDPVKLEKAKKILENFLIAHARVRPTRAPDACAQRDIFDILGKTGG